MKFNSSLLPLLPTPAQLNELSDALISTEELHKIYLAIVEHPRVQTHPEISELFRACLDQVEPDAHMLQTQLEELTYSRSVEPADSEGSSEESTYLNRELDLHPFGVIPDLQRPTNSLTVYDLVKKAFEMEFFLAGQLKECQKSAQKLQQIKLELQLKMSILATEQRHKLLDNQYGFSPGSLLSDLSRKTTKLIFGVFHRPTKD